MRRCTFLFLVLLLVQESCKAVNNSTAGCIDSTSCGPNAQCIKGKCVCGENYTGTGCSIAYQVCADGSTACYFGGTCVLSSTINPVTRQFDYQCDCTNAYAISEADGVQCSKSNYQDCIQNQVGITYAYCLNGGSCKAIIQDGDPNPGCTCLTGFNGLHCEYNNLGNPTTPRMEGGGGMSGLMKFYVVLIVIAGILALVALAIVIKRRRARAKFQKESVDSLKDLHLGTEGETDMHDLKVEEVEMS